MYLVSFPCRIGEKCSNRDPVGRGHPRSVRRRSKKSASSFPRSDFRLARTSPDAAGSIKKPFPKGKGRQTPDMRIHKAVFPAVRDRIRENPTFRSQQKLHLPFKGFVVVPPPCQLFD